MKKTFDTTAPGIAALLQQATGQFQQGRLDDADYIAQTILQKSPTHAEANHLLGLIAAQRVQFDKAGNYFARAISHNPRQPAYHLSLCQVLHLTGRLDEALQSCRKAIQIEPGVAEAHCIHGNILKALGHPDEAATAYEQATRLKPALVEAQSKLGVVLREMGRLPEALAACERATRINPPVAEAFYNLGMVLQEMDCHKEALEAYDRAIQLRPDFAEAYCSRGGVLRVLGRLEEALVACEQSTRIKPELVEAHSIRGNVLMDKKLPGEALAAFDHAIRLTPEYAPAFNNKCLAFKSLGYLGEALAACEQAILLKPDFVEALINHGNILLDASRLEEAEASYRRAAELKPDNASVTENLLFCLNYHPEASPEAVYQAHCAWDRQHAAALHPGTAGRAAQAHPGRLRIGYVSPDFCTHSVAYFFEPLLAAHDRATVELFCYANVPLPDATTARLRARAEHWRSITALPDAAVAEQIQADGIDILVDLAGHSAHNRLLVFARKPAPVQVTWLGYPNTTGMQALDYRLTDAVADPPGMTECRHTETLVRLPGGFLCYGPPDPAPAVAPLPARTQGHITFGSCNKLTKVNARVVAWWAELLQAVPGAQLLLKDKALSDAPTRARYQALFAEHGIESGRLLLEGAQPRTVDHLGRYARIDIGLDPFPYNGTTTTCEALWMGVPVVTLAGESHAGRVGASLLGQAGFPEWVAASPAAYVETARALAGDLEALAATRESLRDRLRNSPLCDAGTFARNLETAYRKMWADACG